MIYLSGDSQLVARVAKLLKLSGQVDGTFAFPHAVSVDLQVGAEPHIEVDGVDGPFESAVVNHASELGTTGKVLLARRGGVRSDRELAIKVPPGDEEAVGRALVRACYEFLSDRRSRRWWVVGQFEIPARFPGIWFAQAHGGVIELNNRSRRRVLRNHFA